MTCLRIFEVAPLKAKDEWISVLAAAHVFGHTHVHEYAVSHLAGLTTAVDKAVLARKYDVPPWVKDAYFAICTAKNLPSDEDLDRLGFEDLKKIARARNELHIMESVTQPVGADLSLVKRIFGLEQPDEVAAPAAVADPELDDWFGLGVPATKKKGKKIGK
jgi:hypothetical protein